MASVVKKSDFKAPIFIDRREDYSIIVLHDGISIAVDKVTAKIIGDKNLLLQRCPYAPHHVLIYHKDHCPTQKQGKEQRFVKLADWIAAGCQTPAPTRNADYMYAPSTPDLNDYRRDSLASKSDLDKRLALLKFAAFDLQWNEDGYTANSPTGRTDPTNTPEQAVMIAADQHYQAAMIEAMRYLTIKKQARGLSERLQFKRQPFAQASASHKHKSPQLE